MNKAIVAAGYETPTPIQAAAIPIVMTGTDLIGTAQTGTGKTAAFVLPILQKLLNTPSQRQTRCMIVTPTRELAEQINDVVEQMAKNTPIRSAAIYGGGGKKRQTPPLAAGGGVLLGCPGGLLDTV
ncbi:MAG: DEAD/DEAH box helicase, partial [Anaerolineae bacterium]|nr:DEAD/DEAH box helicase [Anaerolineae bacterium]